MKNFKSKFPGLFVLCFIITSGLPGLKANNVQLSNVSLMGQNTSTKHTMIQFSVSWDNSWRDVVNWDAAWVFAKYNDGSGIWKHCRLDIVDNNHSVPAGVTLKTGITNISGTNHAMGVFLYRSTNGTGNVSFSNIRLNWNYGSTGVVDNATVQVKVFAVEMVYVPQGSFYTGDGASEFTIGSGGTPLNPHFVTGEGSFSFGNSGSNAYYTSSQQSGEPCTGCSFTIPAQYPKGFSPFYCMKYEISQKQYCDFLNLLPTLEDGNRYSSGNNGSSRYAIIPGTGVGARVANAPDRACNFLSWGDLTAYLDWSGLRPMTDLEFEKACRGPVFPVQKEYAWGSLWVGNINSVIGVDGSGTETKNGSGYMNCNWNDGYLGPVRCGIFAATTTSTSGGVFNRVNAGATYYGIMEMTGNVFERAATLGRLEGRSYVGNHGDGTLSNNGHANEATWPGLVGNEVTGSAGAGRFGGSWNTGIADPSRMSISTRYWATPSTDSGRGSTYGGRGVRSAP